MFKKILIFSFFVSLFYACSTTQEIVKEDKFGVLINDINRIFDDSSFVHAQWGVMIKSLKTDKVWYKRNSNKMFMPASNQKILTTSTALIKLGPDFRFKTSFYSNGEIVDSVLKGDLIVFSDGDPTLYNKFFDSPTQMFNVVADTLKKLGIKQIEGNIIGDDNNFDDQNYGQGWAFDYLDAWYAAPIGPLQLNENSLDISVVPGASVGTKAVVCPNLKTGYIKIVDDIITTDTGRTRINSYRPYGENTFYLKGQINSKKGEYETTLSIYNPTLFYATVLKETLEANGIIVNGNALDCDDIISWNDDLKNNLLIYEFDSPIFTEIAKGLMKRSQNLYAETLVRTMGYHCNGYGSFEEGSKIVAQVLSDLGIAPDTYSYADGSGLTRYDFVSPEQIVKILEYMYKSPYKDPWEELLPIAGVDGTLKNRMKGTAAEGNVKAKTGTISNVRGLSGYLKTLSGEDIVFSFLVNGHLLSSTDTEKITDSVLELITKYK